MNSIIYANFSVNKTMCVYVLNCFCFSYTVANGTFPELSAT